MSPPVVRRLHDRAIDYVAKMPPERAGAWLAWHGLYSIRHDERLHETTRAVLSAEFEKNAALTVLRVWRFQDAVDALAGTPVCALKGIHLLDTVYGDAPGERLLWDIDLLVPEGAVEHASQRLCDSLGLRESADSLSQSERSYHRLLCGDDVTFEVHGRLGIKHGSESGWADLEPVAETVHARSCHVLDPPTLLAHLLAHFAKHTPFWALRWAVDILLIAEPDTDWGAVEARARVLGAWQSVVAACRAFERLLGPNALPGAPQSTGDSSQARVVANERLVWRRLQRGHGSRRIYWLRMQLIRRC